VFVCLLILSTDTFAQKNDSTFKDRVQSNKRYKKLMGLITRDPEPDQGPLHVKSEDPYLKYEGKIIRNIVIKRIGFEQTILDTTLVFKNFLSRTANFLHSNTRESVIRNNLFIREGKPLNPYRVADNERSLRSLEFILDARILVKTISKSADSVDLLVITRDVFNWGGSFSGKFPSQVNSGIKNINVLGSGQRFDYRQVVNSTRKPNFGYEFLYSFSNIMGSFIDATVAYTQLNSGASIGNENESSFHLKISRELYQPFARLAGAIELSDNISRNVFGEADSSFVQYHYKIQDYWIGYTFGYRKQPNNLRENRNRKFIALRAMEQRFMDASSFIEFTDRDGFIYRDRFALLGQVTFFRQDFYKTQYVLGFGRTEDVPYGYRISFTGGFERELGIQRPYTGTELYYNKILSLGTILTYSAKIGSYWSNHGIEDGLFSLNFTRYSKIHQIRRTVYRNQFEAGYALLHNQTLKRGVNIRDVNGIVGFMASDLVGNQRITLSQEITAFTPWKVLGFQLAPIARIDLALIKVSTGLFRERNFFTGISLGVRARNENLIFNTIEARLFYFPITVEEIGHFRLTFKSNFRIKYPSTLVNKPATVFP
jgi:hypothetical protein